MTSSQLRICKSGEVGAMWYRACAGDAARYECYEAGLGLHHIYSAPRC